MVTDAKSWHSPCRKNASVFQVERLEFCGVCCVSRHIHVRKQNKITYLVCMCHNTYKSTNNAHNFNIRSASRSREISSAIILDTICPIYVTENHRKEMELRINKGNLLMSSIFPDDLLPIGARESTGTVHVLAKHGSRILTGPIFSMLIN